VLTVLIVAFALGRGGPTLPIVAVVVGFRRPVVGVVAVVIWAIAVRLLDRPGPAPEQEADLLIRVVGELEGGASPRSALLSAARREQVVDLARASRLIEAGQPTSAVAVAVGAALPHNGRMASAAWALAGDAGSPAAPVMRLLARRAGERGRLDRDRRALTAQARATAWLIAGLPLIVLVFLGLSGRLGSGPALPVVIIGVGLQLTGLGIVISMMRHAS